MQLIEQRDPEVPVDAACHALNVSRASLYRSRRPAEPTQSQAVRVRAPSSRRLDDAERQHILDTLHRPEFADQLGFTMSLFIAQLAFPPGPLLDTAKLAILVGSGVAIVIGLGFGGCACVALSKPWQISSAPNRRRHRTSKMVSKLEDEVEARVEDRVTTRRIEARRIASAPSSSEVRRPRFGLHSQTSSAYICTQTNTSWVRSTGRRLQSWSGRQLHTKDRDGPARDPCPD